MTNIPTLLAYRFTGADGIERALAWCPTCDRYHIHGATSGLRVAHCWHWDAPRVYFINIVGDATPEMLSHCSKRKEEKNFPDNALNELLAHAQEMNWLPQVRIFNPYTQGQVAKGATPDFVGLLDQRTGCIVFTFATQGGAWLVLERHLKRGLLALAPKNFWSEYFGDKWYTNNAQAVAWALIGQHRNHGRFFEMPSGFTKYRQNPFLKLPRHKIAEISDAANRGVL